MSGTLLYSATDTGSRRSVMVVDEGTSVWAYLTGPGSTAPVADCWLQNLVDAPDSLAPYRASKQAPPVTRRFLANTDSSYEARRLPLTEEISSIWSSDGEAVAVLVSDVPLGYMLAGVERGFSKDLVVSGPFGQPFDALQAGGLFGV